MYVHIAEICGTVRNSVLLCELSYVGIFAAAKWILKQSFSSSNHSSFCQIFMAGAHRCGPDMIDRIHIPAWLPFFNRVSRSGQRVAEKRSISDGHRKKPFFLCLWSHYVRCRRCGKSDPAHCAETFSQTHAAAEWPHQSLYQSPIPICHSARRLYLSARVFAPAARLQTARFR